MTHDHRAVYAHRFARVAIVRPPRPPTRMSVAEFEAWLADRPEWSRELYRAMRDLRRQLAGLRLALAATDWSGLHGPVPTSPSPASTPGRVVAFRMRPH